jgi:hypothetical protein
MNTPTPLFAAIVLASLSGGLRAQESEPQALPGKPVLVRRFFDRPIDYWGRGLAFEEESKASRTNEKPPESIPGRSSQPSDWGQMVQLPDGTHSYRELPGPLVELLENPTPQNIRAYFEFRMNRTQKILRAADLIKEYRAALPELSEGNVAPEAPATSARPRMAAEAAPGLLPAATPGGSAKGSPFTITYFHQRHCPHCDRQDVILAEWLKDKPEGKLEVIEFGTQPERWRESKIRGTPTLLMEDSRTKHTAFLEGLSRPEALDRILGECRSGIRPGAAQKGETAK